MDYQSSAASSSQAVPQRSNMQALNIPSTTTNDALSVDGEHSPIVPGSFGGSSGGRVASHGHGQNSIASSSSSSGPLLHTNSSSNAASAAAMAMDMAGVTKGRDLRIQVVPNSSSSDLGASAPVSPGSILDLYARSPSSEARMSMSMSTSRSESRYGGGSAPTSGVPLVPSSTSPIMEVPAASSAHGNAGHQGGIRDTAESGTAPSDPSQGEDRFPMINPPPRTASKTAATPLAASTSSPNELRPRPSYVHGSPSIKAHSAASSSSVDASPVVSHSASGAASPRQNASLPSSPQTSVTPSLVETIGAPTSSGAAASTENKPSLTRLAVESEVPTPIYPQEAAGGLSAGGLSDTTSNATPLATVATDSFASTSGTRTAPATAAGGRDVLVNPASLAAISAGKRPSDLGLTGRPSSDAYAVSDDSGHVMWSQYQSQLEQVDPLGNRSAGPVASGMARNGSSGTYFSPHAVSEADDQFDTTVATPVPVQPGTNAESGVNLEYRTEDGSETFSDSHEKPMVPRRTSSSVYADSTSPKIEVTSPLHLGAVATAAGAAAGAFNVASSSGPTSLAGDASPTYEDARSFSRAGVISPDILPPVEPFARAASALADVRPVAHPAVPTEVEESVSSGASGGIEDLDEEVFSASSLVNSNRNSATTGRDVSSSDSSDYGSDAHEETLQRPPRRKPEAKVTVETPRMGHGRSSSAVGNYLNDEVTKTPVAAVPPMGLGLSSYSPPAVGNDFPPSQSGSSVSTEQQVELESQLAKEADERDPSRPRTLQEARALAKERAKLRQQGSVTAAGSSDSLPNEAGSGQSRPKRDPRRTGTDNASAGVPMSRESSDMSIVNARNALEGKSATDSPEIPQASIASLHATSARDKRLGQVSPILPPKAEIAPETVSTVDEMQAAISATMDDLSFGSVGNGPTASATSLHQQVPKVGVVRPRGSSLNSGGDNNSQPSLQSGQAAIPRLEHAPLYDPAKLAGQPEAPEPVYPRPLATTRVEIYGKTVPWPPAFDSNKIVEKRRNAAWDRAKLYAVATNQLLATPSNLSTWLEMKKRPATKVKSASSQQEKSNQKQQSGAGMLGRQGRQEASYAASIRSDMTFPMRGDGGKAKEITGTTLTSVSEVPSMPSNVPYPGVVANQYGSTGRGAAERPTLESVGAKQNSIGQSAGSFFGGLARRGSSNKRAESAGGLSPLTKSTSRGTTRPAISSPAGPVVIVGPQSSSTQSNRSTGNLALANRSSPALVGGPRSFGEKRSPSPTKSSIPAAYILHDPTASSPTPPSPITSMSPPSAAGAMYSGIPRANDYSRSRDGTSPNRLSNEQFPAASSYSGGAGNAGRPAVGARSSLSYGSVRGGANPGFEDALDKVADVLPDADRFTLANYLRRANGDDLAAISAYLQDQSSDGKFRSR